MKLPSGFSLVMFQRSAAWAPKPSAQAKAVMAKREAMLFMVLSCSLFFCAARRGWKTISSLSASPDPVQLEKPEAHDRKSLWDERRHFCSECTSSGQPYPGPQRFDEDVQALCCSGTGATRTMQALPISSA